jgi:site-specific DNA-methyltransferase (adenine-specific)
MTAKNLPLTKRIRISDINLDARVRDLDPDVVADYAESLKEGDRFPALTVFSEDEVFYLADGFHRLAANAEGVDTATCEVRMGGLRNARLFACAANRINGLRMTNADKRAAVTVILRDKTWCKWTNHRIAKHVGVSHTFVGKMRTQLASTGIGCKSALRVGADGREIDTTRIGSRSGSKSPDNVVQRPASVDVVPLVAAAQGEYDIRHGHVLDVLRGLPDDSVHAVVTSPPYFNLRDYETDPVVFGGEQGCDHQWDNAQSCRCGAWQGELGQELTVEMYVEHMVQIFRDVRRVLRPDGSLWLNIGDTLKNQRLSLVPERVSLALQADGWTVRNRIAWEKANPKPSSIRTRVRDTTEAVFVLSPTDGLPYYDDWALMEESSSNRWLHRGTDVWRLSATQKKVGDHVASFSTRLPARCIQAATSARGCCPACGASYKRIVKQNRKKTTTRAPWMMTLGFATTGWEATCHCDAGGPVPCTVLDPFSGSGTTLEAAVRHGRRALGVELNSEYADSARTRLAAISRPGDPPDLRLSMGDALVVAVIQDAA